MSRRALRKFRRRIASSSGIALSGYAGRGGPARIKRIGRLIGQAHYWLTWPFNRRLRGDIARALNVSKRKAGKILYRAFRDNDRAVFEIISLAHPRCDANRLIDTVTMDGLDRLRGVQAENRGAILLGMHMGNGILMAARLAREGFPVHVVFRDPRRLPPGLLGRSLQHAGCVPVPLDRVNPTRSFRQMLKILASGGMVYVLMDQANKGDGAEKTFLGKKVRMPTGIAALAVRTGAPVVPIHAESAHPGWHFRVDHPLAGTTADEMLDAMLASMQQQIVRRPSLWAWHHRRWKRYHFDC